MKINATLPEKGTRPAARLFRGVAQLGDFSGSHSRQRRELDHHQKLWLSDAADLFVFISGYTASFVYARMMIDRGFIVGATRLTKRVWQLYVAHVILFVIYIVSIGYVAQRYSDPEIINEFNVAGLVENPIETLRQGLLLKFKPVNLDVLPLYIALMGLFPPVLWMMLRQPGPDDAGFGCAVARSPAVRLESAGPTPPVPGTSTRTAGRCCLCSAPGARSAGPERISRSSMHPSRFTFALRTSSWGW